MTNNVFADLRFENPEEELLKARLVSEISLRIEKSGLSHEAASDLLGIEQPKVFALLKGYWEGYSVERLRGFVEVLGQPRDAG